jgi:hypothetical protein
MRLIDLQQELAPGVWVWARWQGQPLGCAWMGRVVRVRAEGIVLDEVACHKGELRIRWEQLRTLAAHAERREWEVMASVAAVQAAVVAGKAALLPMKGPAPVAQEGGGGEAFLASLGVR